MKFNRFFLAAALGIAAAMVAPTTGLAQNVGLVPVLSTSATIVIQENATNTIFSYTLTNGVQNGVITTNTYNSPAGFTTAANTNLLSVSVGEYDYAGLTFGGTGTATSTNSLQVFTSYDNGATYGALPAFQYLNFNPGAARFGTNVSLDIHGVTTLAFVVQGASAAGTTRGTNIVLKVNLKSPRLQTQQAGNSSGSTPGSTPITVPNFP